jgi:cobalt-zinc-cadmium efflux system protein
MGPHHDHSHPPPSHDRPCGGHPAHSHVWDTGYKVSEKKKLLWSIVITFIVMVVEIIGGFLSNSIALLSDAGHMFTHFFALAVSYAAIRLASLKPSFYRTFGLYRAEVIASLINGILLVSVSLLIVYESIIRIVKPQNVASKEMFIIATIGLVVNIITILILEGSHQHDRNIRSAFIHMFADAVSSVAVVGGAIVIYYTKFTLIDPIIGLFISVLILFWSWGLLKDAIRVLLEIAPAHIPPHEIRALLKENDKRIIQITDMHVTEITNNMYNFSAHVEIEGESLIEANDIVREINELLSCKYSITHTTIQITRVIKTPPKFPEGGL